MKFFATCAKGLEYLLVDELRALGAEEAHEALSGVYFSGELEHGYRACLWSRLANRILVRVGDFPCQDADALYEGVKAIDWSEHFSPKETFAITFSARQNPNFRDNRFGALKSKDALCDQMRTRYGKRPDVDAADPDLRVHVVVRADTAEASLELTDSSLHQRGYRTAAGEAPLRETLAAAILYRAGWPALAAEGAALLDPMCGSGTLLVEGALMAADIAPGIVRENAGPVAWLHHEPMLWQQLREEAETRRARGLESLGCRIRGFDADPKVIAVAEGNIRRAGLGNHIEVSQRSIEGLTVAEPDSAGLLVCNPPYGERLGDVDALKPLYRQLGKTLKSAGEQWRGAVITSEKELARELGIRAQKTYKLFNGALECDLYIFELSEGQFFTPFDPEKVAPDWDKGLRDSARMLANRLRKNQQRLKSWRIQNEISSYRLYDADLPEYSAAIDIYGDQVHVQEYAPPKTIPDKVAERHLAELVRVASGVLQIPQARISVKARQRQKGQSQYQRLSRSRDFFVVTEGGLKFRVNLRDYLDTGLFLDHRKTRDLVRKASAGKRVLNLFGYTGSVSVYAAAGGAHSVTTVDMSKTYLDWAKSNFSLNGLQGNHFEFVQADCLQWLEAMLQSRVKPYDLIFLDPPTFSNSKRMEQVFDVQRDHDKLIRACMMLLKPDGQLLFSNNFRKFKMDPALREQYRIQEITARTLPPDFAKSRNHHRCWEIRHEAAEASEPDAGASRTAAIWQGRK